MRIIVDTKLFAESGLATLWEGKLLIRCAVRKGAELQGGLPIVDVEILDLYDHLQGKVLSHLKLSFCGGILGISDFVLTGPYKEGHFIHRDDWVKELLPIFERWDRKWKSDALAPNIRSPWLGADDFGGYLITPTHSVEIGRTHPLIVFYLSFAVGIFLKELEEIGKKDEFPPRNEHEGRKVPLKDTIRCFSRRLSAFQVRSERSILRKTFCL
ncbi:MAG: hypothetical protein A2648_01370 [Candidatus Lloydbacteria bacterium RIFCSPHIGHO2_01_FULL_41_20]|uniref:Uncharacterized protein n=1 Tax=Candidatus Lloydbacteria bacterium RIFCSPHIGHO2_01_FULL_41_20 TaxID=1798657 RepID=A0A1G2CSN7_9BACT|nr:MAG: hypothetical protein A2648_01370 [Candidatus Lloydbacteria bacterium RIFCSPHIGHO2_01_FULL_41_20]